jgi:hypothetical protein
MTEILQSTIERYSTFDSILGAFVVTIARDFDIEEKRVYIPGNTKTRATT